jgi:hypothetical protein
MGGNLKLTHPDAGRHNRAPSDFRQSRKRAGVGVSLGNQIAYLSFSFVVVLKTENTHGLCQ